MESNPYKITGEESAVLTALNYKQALAELYDKYQELSAKYNTEVAHLREEVQDLENLLAEARSTGDVLHLDTSAEIKY